MVRTAVRLLSLLIWWFAVLDMSGNIQFSEHRTQRGCNAIRNSYAKVKFLTVTECKWRPDRREWEDVG